MLVYMGVGFLLFGILLVIATATGGFDLTAFTALGGLVSSMGLILSYLGLKTRDDVGNDTARNTAVTHIGITQPLAYLQTRIELNHEKQRKTSGNKAIGIVLISLGVFVSAVSGTIGPFFGWGPLLLTGVGFLVAGVLLRRF